MGNIRHDARRVIDFVFCLVAVEKFLGVVSSILFVRCDVSTFGTPTFLSSLRFFAK